MRRLEVDWVARDGHGLCAALLPERVALDDWAYPVIGDPEVPEPLLRHARAAVSACPALALRLSEVERKRLRVHAVDIGRDARRRRMTHGR